jgi:hypothetical protein
MSTNPRRSKATSKREALLMEKAGKELREGVRQSWLKGMGINQRDLPEYVSGYRADPTGRYGGKEGLETLPTKLGAAELYAKVRAMKLGEPYGVPQLDVETLAALALKEGSGPSGVFGVDPIVPKSALSNKDPDGLIYSLSNNTDYDPAMKGDKELYDNLIRQGINGGAAAFAVRLANKDKVAKRLGIPLGSAWVGTGHSGYESSNEYADSLDQFRKIAAHPKNRGLLEFINLAISPQMEKKYRSGGNVERVSYDRKLI